MTTRLLIALALTATLGACASKPKDITPSYVSHLEYQNYSCAQLIEEAERVSSRATAANGLQKRQRTSDQITTTIGAVIFWPSLFFIEGDGPKAVEVARLKGQMEAIERASILKGKKGCKITFTRA